MLNVNKYNFEHKLYWCHFYFIKLKFEISYYILAESNNCNKETK